jgi:hypothetical protein
MGICTSLAIAAALLTTAPGVAADDRQRVVVVDRSGSMGRLHWLAEFWLAAEEHGASTAGGDTAATAALVVFTAEATRVPLDGGAFGSAPQLARALSQLPSGGGAEDGYKAIREALAAHGTEAAEGLRLVLFTDEDRDALAAGESRGRLVADLLETGSVLDAIVEVRFTCADGRAALSMDSAARGYLIEKDVLETCEGVTAESGRTSRRAAGPGGQPGNLSIPHYVEFAHLTGGMAWDIAQARKEGHRLFAWRVNGPPAGEVEPVLTPAMVFGAVAHEAVGEGDRVARGQAFPAVAAPGQIVTLDGSVSRPADPDSFIVGWEWDFDGDAEYDASGEVVATSFDAPGRYVVGLRVTGSDYGIHHGRVIVQVAED